MSLGRLDGFTLHGRRSGFDVDGFGLAHRECYVANSLRTAVTCSLIASTNAVHNDPQHIRRAARTWSPAAMATSSLNDRAE